MDADLEHLIEIARKVVKEAHASAGRLHYDLIAELDMALDPYGDEDENWDEFGADSSDANTGEF